MVFLKKLKLSEKKVIQLFLNSKTFNKKFSIILPNVFYQDKIEADLLSILPSGYTHEFEIKLSRTDLLADRKKTKRLTRKYLKSIDSKVPTPYEKTKHEWLELGCLLPNYFTYILAEGVGDAKDIPDYCGLIYIDSYGKFTEVRKPKLLHKRKISLENKCELYRKFVYRYNRKYIEEK